MRTLSVRKCKFEKAISCDGAQNLSDWDVSFPHQGRVLPSMLIRYERDVFITIIEAEVKRALRTEGGPSFGDVDCDSGLRGPRLSRSMSRLHVVGRFPYIGIRTDGRLCLPARLLQASFYASVGSACGPCEKSNGAHS